MPVRIRDGYNFCKGDIAVLSTGERATIDKFDYRGIEGTVAYCKVVLEDGRSLDYTCIECYEKKAA